MALTGNLRELPFTDLVQTCCSARSTTHISFDFGDDMGSIFLQNGEIIAAETGNLKGEKAFYKILLRQEGSFLAESNPEFLPKPTITRSWRHLLLDGMRLIDEIQMGIADPDSLEPSYLDLEDEITDETIVFDTLDKPLDSISSSHLIDENKSQIKGHFSSEDKDLFELAAQNSSDEHDALLQNLLSSGVVKGGVVIDEDGSTICEINENDPRINRLAFLVKGVEDIVMSAFNLGELNGAVLEVQQKSLLIKNFQNLSLVFARPERVPIVRAFEGVQKAFEGALGLTK